MKIQDVDIYEARECSCTQQAISRLGAGRAKCIAGSLEKVPLAVEVDVRRYSIWSCIV